MTWALMMAERRHRTFLLTHETIAALNDAAQVAGLAPSRVIEHLVGELAKFGAHRIRWTQSPDSDTESRA